MAVLPITLFGDSILRTKAEPVTKVDKRLKDLIDNMFETMYNANGMGLAANQVGSGKSLFIVDISEVKGFEDTKPMVFINPRIIKKSEEKKPMEEGCLSLPGLRGEVIRPIGITLSYMDLSMEKHTLQDSDLLARVIQHEYDHLQGKFFIDRMPAEAQKLLEPELLKIKSRDMKFEYPVTKKK